MLTRMTKRIPAFTADAEGTTVTCHLTESITYLADIVAHNLFDAVNVKASSTQEKEVENARFGAALRRLVNMPIIFINKHHKKNRSA